MEKYRHVRTFDVGFCDVDFKDELKISKTLTYFEEIACSSADELGFGYSVIKPLGYAFMVTEIRCRIQRFPKLGERIQAVTWPTPPSYVVFGREYELRSALNEPLVLATSRWCMVDMKSGKLLPSKTFSDQDYSTYNTDRAYTGTGGKIARIAPEEGICRYSMTVGNSEYDHNMHVNNTRYADYCLNCFSVEELSQRRLSEFAISYVKQCREGEKLSFFRKDEAGKSLVCGFNGENELVVRAEVCFEDSCV